MDPISQQVKDQALDLAREILVERRRERRFRWLGRIFWVGVIAATVVALISLTGRSAYSDRPTSEDHISVVKIDGPMFAGSRASAEYVIAGLRDAFEQQHSKAVFLVVNSPGGSPSQAATINDAIVRFKDENRDKPVYAIVTDLCASACYYAIAHADKIVASPVSLVGSIGVVLQSFDIRVLSQKLGVRQRLLTAGRHKDLLNPFRPLDPEVKEHLQRLLDQTHAEFISVVKSGRGNRIRDDESIYSGLIWAGGEAFQLGLVDAFGDAYSVAEKDFGGSPLIDYTPKPSLLKQIIEASGDYAQRALLSHGRLELASPLN